MATFPLPTVLATLGGHLSASEPDAELLSRYVTERHEAAFAAVVYRYARLVWQVARTRCRTEATAEEVFQATFVVLARKAASVRSAAALPGWLHRTAHRLAVRAARRERPTTPLPTDTAVSTDPLDALTARELLAAVDDEMAKLSDTERSVLVLCGVENQSLDEAATRLGCTVGAVKGRLERARVKLRTRLTARGLTLPAVALGLITGPPARAVNAAVTLPGGPVPPAVEHLIAGGTHMTRRFIALGLAAVLVAGGVGTGFGLVPRGGPAAATAAPVPKEKGAVAVWSEPMKVDWQASGAQRITGIWTPDGKGVLVPRMTPDAQDELLDFGGIDFRDADTGKVMKTLKFAGEKGGQMFLPTSLAVSSDGKAVYASGAVFSARGKGEAARGVVTWKDVSKDDPPETTTDASPVDTPIVLSADGKCVVTLALGASVEAKDTARGLPLWTSKIGGGRYGKLSTLAYLPKEGTVASGTDKGEWIATDGVGRTLFVITNLGMSVRTIAASADGKVTAFGGTPLSNGKALLITAKDAPDMKDAVPEKVTINGLAFSPDGKRLAAACSDGEVRVYDAATGKMVESAKEHKESVFSVAYSPDGKKLLTVGKDAIKVWDVEALPKAK